MPTVRASSHLLRSAIQRVGKRGPALGTVAAGALVLGGCAVQPQPLDPKAVHGMAEADQKNLDKGQASVKDPITMEEAIARAVKYNRGYRVKLMESAMEQASLGSANLDMLPDLTAQAGYRNRNKVASTTSQTAGGNVSDTPTISQERIRRTSDLTLRWSILDFGVSYVRAQQQADRYLIAKEKERKAIQNVIHEVRNKYWDAVSAQRLLGEIEPLMARVEAALARSRKAEAQQLQEPKAALTYQRQLLQMKRSLQQLKTDLVGAKGELAALIGLPPGTDYRLAGTTNPDYALPDLSLDLATMERTALMRRPELMQSRYKERVSRKEVRASLLEMLPDLSLGVGVHYDSNKFLEHNNWTHYGSQVSWNLMQVFQGPAGMDAAEAREKVAQQRQMALSMSVLSQLHLANAAFQQAKANFRTAQANLDVSKRILKETRAQQANDQADQMQVIQEELNAVLAELRRDVAYARVQNGFGRIFLSMGLDPLPATVESHAIDDLADAVERRMQRWRSGELNLVTRPLAEQDLTMTGSGQESVQFAADTFGVLGGTVTYTARAADGGALPSWLTFDAETRTFRGNPPADAGPVAIRVTAKNEAGVTATDEFKLRIEEANDAPRVNRAIEAQEPHLKAGENGRFRLARDTFVDPDGDELRLSARQTGFWQGGQLPDWLSFDADSGTFSGKPPQDVEAIAMRVTATDPQGAEATNEFVLRVEGESQADGAE